MFHVSSLKKCLSDGATVVILLDEIQIDEQLNFIKEPLEIMDREVKQLKQSRILILKVRWNSKRGPEFTWERKEDFKRKYPHLLSTSIGNTNWNPGRISKYDVGAVTLGNFSNLFY